MDQMPMTSNIVYQIDIVDVGPFRLSHLPFCMGPAAIGWINCLLNPPNDFPFVNDGEDPVIKRALSIYCENCVLV
jgi:hypothetical protein